MTDYTKYTDNNEFKELTDDYLINKIVNPIERVIKFFGHEFIKDYTAIKKKNGRYMKVKTMTISIQNFNPKLNYLFFKFLSNNMMFTLLPFKERFESYIKFKTGAAVIVENIKSIKSTSTFDKEIVDEFDKDIITDFDINMVWVKKVANK